LGGMYFSFGLASKQANKQREAGRYLHRKLCLLGVFSWEFLRLER
jgi:hypothetical protein